MAIKIQDIEELTLILDVAAKNVLKQEELKKQLHRAAILFVSFAAITGIAVIATCSKPVYIYYLLVFLAVSYWIMTYFFARMFWLLSPRKIYRVLLLAIVIPGSLVFMPVFVYGLGGIPSFHAQKSAQEEISTVIMYLEGQRRLIGHPPSSIQDGLGLIDPGPFSDELEYFRGRKHFAIKIPLYNKYLYHLSIMYSSKSRSWERGYGKTASIALAPDFRVIGRFHCQFNSKWTIEKPVTNRSQKKVSLMKVVAGESSLCPALR